MGSPRLALLALAASLLGCGYISFGRRVTIDEIVLQQEIRAFYNDLQRTYAAGNPQALASLFSPSITHPMTHAEIRAWAEGFFGEHKRARLRIDKLVFEGLSYVQASVTISYRVETPSGRGSFAATESHSLEKRKRRWYVSSWEKLR